jgi:hypothetical protein
MSPIFGQYGLKKNSPILKSFGTGDFFADMGDKNPPFTIRGHPQNSPKSFPPYRAHFGAFAIRGQILSRFGAFRHSGTNSVAIWGSPTESHNIYAAASRSSHLVVVNSHHIHEEDTIYIQIHLLIRP